MANRAQVTVRMSADLRAKLEMHAAAAKTTPAGFARELIRRGLKHDLEGSTEPGQLTMDQIERLFAAAITAEQAWLIHLKNKSPDLRRAISDRAREEAAALVGRRVPKRRPAPSPAPREEKKSPPRTREEIERANHEEQQRTLRELLGAENINIPEHPTPPSRSRQQREQEAEARRQKKLREIVGAENISIPEG